MQATHLERSVELLLITPPESPACDAFGAAAGQEEEGGGDGGLLLLSRQASRLI